MTGTLSVNKFHHAHRASCGRLLTLLASLMLCHLSIRACRRAAAEDLAASGCGGDGRMRFSGTSLR
jgi:hypothetical protein